MHILLDIEGTTTPITFVYDVLFPFARAALGPYVHQTIDAPQTRAALAQLRADMAAELATSPDAPVVAPEDAPASELAGSAARALDWLMDRDRKATGLKTLQGLVWQQGYEDGRLRGVVFADVAPQLRAWREAGVPVSIYSSGSVQAQQLLFRYAEPGDLTTCLTAYFDTRVGGKREAASYRAIAEQLGIPAHELCFFTDIVEEADAATAAGARAWISVRPGNAPLPAGQPHATATSLTDLAARVAGR